MIGTAKRKQQQFTTLDEELAIATRRTGERPEGEVPMQPSRLLAIVALVGLVGVEYGGWALLTFITGRAGLSDAQKRFFRAGHAHAGTLLVLSLVYFRYLPDTSLSKTLQWTAGILLLIGIMAQSGGFFLHLATDGRDASSAGTRLTRTGGLVLASALLLLSVGLATA